MIFVFLSSREKVPDTKEFSRENSKHCQESRFLTRTVKPCMNNFFSAKIANLIIFSIFLIYVLFSKILSGGNIVWSTIFIHNFQ